MASRRESYYNPNQTRPSSNGRPKSNELFKRKSEKKLSLFFGPEQYHNHNQNEDGFFSKSRMENLKHQGFLKGIHINLQKHNPILLKFILILGLPLFMCGILLMFLAALVCIFFTGIYIMVTELFREFGCVTAIILLPGAIVLGGIGATLFPWIFRRYIMQIHYEFWFEFAQEYFKQLCSICC